MLFGKEFVCSLNVTFRNAIERLAECSLLVLLVCSRLCIESLFNQKLHDICCCSTNDLLCSALRWKRAHFAYACWSAHIEWDIFESNEELIEREIVLRFEIVRDQSWLCFGPFKDDATNALIECTQKRQAHENTCWAFKYHFVCRCRLDIRHSNC